MKTGFRKRLDYILTEGYVKQYTTNCRVFRKASEPFETDHRMVAMFYKFPTNAEHKELRKKRGRKPLESKPNIKLLAQDEQARVQFSEVTENILTTASITENDVESLNNNITEALQAATEQTIARRTVAKQPWANEHFLSLLDEQKVCTSPERTKELKKEKRNVGRN